MLEIIHEYLSVYCQENRIHTRCFREDLVEQVVKNSKAAQVMVRQLKTVAMSESCEIPRNLESSQGGDDPKAGAF